MKVSVIIITRNRALLLKYCLKSLVTQTKKPDEVVIVNNNSDDSTKKVINDFRKKLKIKYLFEQRIGIPIARNTGIKNAKNDIIAFIDDDCVADKKWIENLLKCHKRHDGISIIQGKSINKIQDNYFAEGMEYLIRTNPPVIDSKNISFKKGCIKRYLFEENFLRSSDFELGIRLKKDRKRIISSEEIIVHHHYKTNLKSFAEQQIASGKYAYLIKQENKQIEDLLPKDLQNNYFIFVSLIIMPFVTIMRNLEKAGIKSIVYLPFLFLQKIFRYYGFFNEYFKIKRILILQQKSNLS